MRNPNWNDFWLPIETKFQEVPLILKIAVFWVVAPCSLVEVYQRFRGPCCFHHQGNLPDYMALQPRRQPSSYSPPWEPQIPLINFWDSLIQEYPNVGKTCTVWASSLCYNICVWKWTITLYYNKNKIQEHIQRTSNIRLQLCSITPNIKWITKKRSKNNSSIASYYQFSCLETYL
jgi:hypothetical protein